MEAQIETAYYRSLDEIRKVVDHRRNLDGVWLLQKSCCWRSPDIDEAWKKLGVKSIVTGGSLEEIRRVVDHYRKSAGSEAQRAFGAV